MPTTRLYPFVGVTRSYGGGGPAWATTGSEPRLLSAADGNYLTASMPLSVMPDTDSLDCTTWKQSNGSLLPWGDKLITYLNFFISIYPNVPGVTMGMAVANSSLGGAANIGNLPLSLPPDTMTNVNIANAAPNAPPTIVGWYDYARDHLRNQDLLFSVILSNRFAVVPWVMQIHEMYLDVTWSYLYPPALVTEY